MSHFFKYKRSLDISACNHDSVTIVTSAFKTSTEARSSSIFGKMDRAFVKNIEGHTVDIGLRGVMKEKGTELLE